MDLTHRISVPASLDDTWAVFARPQRLAPCFPGVTITSADGDDFTGSIKVKLGPLTLVYVGAGRYVKRDLSARRLEIEFHGSDRRGHGSAEGTVIAGFTATDDATGIEVQTDLTLTGKPEQFGLAVLSDVNDRLLEQFASCLAGRFADGSLPEPETEAEIAEFAIDADAPTVDFSTFYAEVAEGPEVGTEPPARSDLAPGSERTPPVTSGSVARSASSAPSPAPTLAPEDRTWVPATNYAETDFEMLRRVVPPLLKRYWPFLGGAGVAAFVASKIAASRKKKRR